MVKHCKHGTCKSDDRFLDRESTPVNFFVFPKPCKDFKLLEKDPTLKIEHCESTCETCVDFVPVHGDVVVDVDSGVTTGGHGETAAPPPNFRTTPSCPPSFTVLKHNIIKWPS